MKENMYLENLSLLQKQLPDIEELLQKKWEAYIEESKEIEPEDITDCTILLVYKVGTHDLLLEWLEKDKERKIIFLEDDLLALQHFLRQEAAKDWLMHERIQFRLLHEETIKKICWEYPFLDKKMITWRHYQSQIPFMRLKENFSHWSYGVEASFSWYGDFGKQAMHNFYLSLLRQEKKYYFSSLENKAYNIPAIICGAGPSIQGSSGILQKMQNKALLFAGGTAMNVLEKSNIAYHFAANIEKRNLYERIKELKQGNKPFFFRPIVAEENIKLQEGPLYYVSDHEAMPIEKFCEEKLSWEVQDLDGGWTVTTMLVALAKFMGCNPIILVGVDLCYDQQKYAHDLFVTKNEEEPIKKENIYGDEVITQKDWLVAASWLEDFATLHPQTTFINCSEGLWLKGFAYKKIEDCLLDKEHDLLGLSHFLLSYAKPLSYDLLQLRSLFSTIKTSLVTCLHYVEKILQLWEEQQNIVDSIYEKLLEEQEIYQVLFAPIWRVWKPFLLQKACVEKALTTKEVEKINKMIFLQKIITQHLEIIKEIYGKICSTRS